MAATQLVTADDFDATWQQLNQEYEAAGYGVIVDKYNEILAKNQEKYNQYVNEKP